MDAPIIDLLRKCNIPIGDTTQLDGLLILRDALLSSMIYEKVKPDITELRKKYSSSSLTSLQKTAEMDQKWPLLNLVRQVLKIHNYHMKPVRMSDGYTKEGKKKYKRYFLIRAVAKKEAAV
mgnify:CR=1 FL=1